MGWRDEWYPDTVAALCELRGAGALMTDGLRMPMISALESLSVIGRLSGSISGAVVSFHNSSGREAPLEVGNARHVPESLYVDAGSSEYFGILGDTISVDKWLAGMAPNPLRGWRRTNGAPWATGKTEVDVVIASTQRLYSPFGIDTPVRVQEPAIAMQLRELCNAWERAVRAVTGGIMHAGPDISARLDDTYGAALWKAVRQACTALDILRENPPEETYERVRAAAAHSLARSADFAGSAAASIASKVGETAGQIGEGFFREAGFMSLLVAGIAVFAFMR